MTKLRVTVASCVTAVSLTAAMTMASGVRKVDVDDRCEPDSFNAAIGDGTCIGDGNVTFEEFLEELNPQDFGHDKWRFNFGRGRVDSGETLRAVNRGGEFHTFTEVAEFGGGCIPDLNIPLGLTPVPECADLTTLPNGDQIPTAFIETGINPGASRDVAGLEEGTHKFMCLIHPWMKTTVKVRD